MACRRERIGGGGMELRLGRGGDGHEGVHGFENGALVRATPDDHTGAEVDVRGVVGEGYYGGGAIGHAPIHDHAPGLGGSARDREAKVFAFAAKSLVAKAPIRIGWAARQGEKVVA